jgi:hypothetical protein
VRYSSIAGFLVGVSVPYDIVRQAKYFFARTPGHFGEAFCLGLVFKSVRGEVNACDRYVRLKRRKLMHCKQTFSVDVGFDNNADSSHTVERDFDVLVVAPVAHACHVDTLGLVFLVTCITSVRISGEFRGVGYAPSARITLGSRDAASLRPASDSCHEL